MKTSKLTLVCDIYELTNKDGKNIQKLAREIEEGKGIAGRFRNGIFKKSSYNVSTILLAKITYKYQGREETLSLLHYAISHKNNQAVKDLLEEAKKQKLLKEVLNEEMTTKHSDGREEIHTILTDAISRRDNDMIRAVLKISEENGILKEIVKKRITIKHSNGEEMTYTPFTYAEARKNSEAVEEILKFSGELFNKRATQKPTVVTAKTTTAKDENSKEVHEVCKYSVINIEHKDATHVIDKATETDTKLCNINSEDLQPICESSEEVQNDSTTVEPTSVDRADSPSFAEPCSGSGNTVTLNTAKTGNRSRYCWHSVIGERCCILCFENRCHSSSSCGSSWIGVYELCAVQYHKPQHQARESGRYRTANC
ncbi:hypothetical protein NMD99_01780 [Wolbachia endosymbiont of Listronotus oregonensis]|uniref:WD_0033/WD_0034 family tandem repeat-containing protein n=1 Tax=unclassified Wolbachia TaxID=2640676 RepID=UPI002232632C|nr:MULTISPECIES: hypothetical protein [unclassified Wolbachia]WMT84759.1 hypothetical protein NMD99_01780 [Wolbachia endosymbiont of Listronotus oregonensis]